MKKVCTQCGVEQDIDNFAKRKHYTKDGHFTICKSCRNANDRERYKKAKELKEKRAIKYPKCPYPYGSKEYSQYYHLLFRYGITLEEKEKLLDDHEYKCAVCGKEENLCVDHCHKTGKVRGVLCKSCNAGVGRFFDNEEIFTKVIEYLNKHKD